MILKMMAIFRIVNSFSIYSVNYRLLAIIVQSEHVQPYVSVTSNSLATSHDLMECTSNVSSNVIRVNQESILIKTVQATG